MAEDASLDDFLDGDDTNAERTVDDAGERADDAEQVADDAPAAAADADQVTDDADTVTPARSTYAWSDDGGRCDDCGAVVDSRWAQDDGLVCPDCKVW